MVEDAKFARDKKSRAVINTDSTAYSAYKTARGDHLKIVHLNNQVNSLKNEISDIKSLLIELINGKNNG